MKAIDPIKLDKNYEDLKREIHLVFSKGQSEIKDKTFYNLKKTANKLQDDIVAFIASYFYKEDKGSWDIVKEENCLQEFLAEVKEDIINITIRTLTSYKNDILNYLNTCTTAINYGKVYKVSLEFGNRFKEELKEMIDSIKFIINIQIKILKRVLEDKENLLIGEKAKA